MTSTLPSGIYIANADEIDAIVEIEKKCFPGKVAYSKRQLEHLILNANSDCLVEKQDGIIRAFLIVTYRQKSLTCNIETIDVDPAFKNRGTGYTYKERLEVYYKLEHNGTRNAIRMVKEL